MVHSKKNDYLVEHIKRQQQYRFHPTGCLYRVNHVYSLGHPEYIQEAIDKGYIQQYNRAGYQKVGRIKASNALEAILAGEGLTTVKGRQAGMIGKAEGEEWVEGEEGEEDGL